MAMSVEQLLALKALLTRNVCIKSFRSDLYLTDAYPIENGLHELEQRRKLLNDYGELHESQVWYVLAVDQYNYFIVNKQSGKLLNVNNDSRLAGDPVQLLSYQNFANSKQTWKLQPTRQFKRLLFYVGNSKSGLRLTVKSIGGDWNPKVRQHNQTREIERFPLQLWDFVEYEVFEDVLVQIRNNSREIDNIGEVNKMTANNLPPSSPTTSVLVGQLLVPYLFIKDPTRKNRLEQLHTSCVYFLNRYSYWNLIYFHDHPGDYDIEDSLSDIKLGLLSGNDRQIYEIIGVTINVNGDIVIEESPMKDVFSSSFVTRLKYGRNALDAVGETSLSCEIDHFTERKEAVAMWVVEDRYDLCDKTGHRILEWTVRRQKCDKPLNPTIEIFNHEN